MGRLRFAGGPIFTGDATDPWVEAVLVADGRILAVGTEDELRAADPGAEPFDLAGDTLVPGFVDAHNHFLATGETLGSLDVHFPAVASAADLLDVVASAAASTPAGAAITGSGLDTGKFAIPPLDDLDRAAGDHPLYLHHISGHAALVNTTAFALAGVPVDVADPPGGRFDRDPEGRLSGMCFDAAMGLVMPTAVDVGTHGPNFHVRSAPAELIDAVERAGTAFLAAGLTTVCDAQVTVRELGAYRAAR